MQEMQEQMNSMNASGEFQEVGSNHSGRLSYFFQLTSSEISFHAGSRQRLTHDTWNTSGS